MSLQSDWKAISGRIQGILETGRLFLQFWGHHSSDPYSVIKKDLLPHSKDIFKEIVKFHELYRDNLHPSAVKSLEKFVNDYENFIHHTDGRKDEGYKLLSALSHLASFCAEFNFQLSDFQAVAKRITERAFIHLQRCIIADPDLKNKWIEAFNNRGETACEKLGASHLLLHGIWAFKASSEGERTDLILGEPLEDLSQVESVAEALVLTEWKLVRDSNQIESQAKKAYIQASIYSQSLMAGFELTGYRYLILVSKNRILKMPSDVNEGQTMYRYFNIAVDPKTPSKT